MNRNKLFLNSSLQKAAEFAGAAGEFRCQSLHCGPSLHEIFAICYLLFVVRFEIVTSSIYEDAMHFRAVANRPSFQLGRTVSGRAVR